MEIPELVLNGPDTIVASLPFIIGFTPTESLVVMWLRDGCVRLTMRLDLPRPGEPHESWVDAVMAHCQGHDEVIVCVLGATDPGARLASGELRGQPLVEDLLAGLRNAECAVRDALLVVDTRWWSFLCQEPECCPSAGTEINATVADAVAARFALSGVGWLADREAVVSLCATESDRQAEVLPLVHLVRGSLAASLAADTDPARALERWRDGAIALVCEALLTPTPADPRRDAEVLVSLCDVRVRDTVLWEVAHSVDHDPHRSFERAASLLRCAPAGVIAPIGTVTGLLGWLLGDGVRAIAALDRVRDENNEYALAELLARSIAAGLPPTEWRQMMGGLTREACRGPRVLAVP